jgi:hypothetical protein
MVENNGKTGQLLKNSLLYRNYEDQLHEILKHKWIESEKAGRDIGFNCALIDWLMKYGREWRLHCNKSVLLILWCSLDLIARGDVFELW